MQVIVVAAPAQQEALTAGGTNEGFEIAWIENPAQVLQYKKADGFIDLLFTNDAARVSILQQVLPAPVIVNSVVDTLDALPDGFVRINGWPGFLEGPVMEAAGDESLQAGAAKLLAAFGKKVTWLPDTPGFITPRVVSMIINEAYAAITDGVSTADAINTAMKLGTNYPYGPFEWAEKIGVAEVRGLLQKLAASQPRYQPFF